MKTSTSSVGSLIDHINKGQIRLPEIQRGYVWKPPAVSALIDSLYRLYPSGSLLLWEADEPIRERAAAISGPSEAPMMKPLYLLDGQQRLTSLHRVYSGHEHADVVFNVEAERFQVASAATKKDIRWVSVHGLLTGKINTFHILGELAQKVDLEQEIVHGRLERVKKISDYTYYLEILEGIPYEEVTSIFVRVNSRGKPLRATDLALATLSARWPGVVAKVNEVHDHCAAQGYPNLDATFLTRCLAALLTDTASPKAFASAELGALEEAWGRTKAGVDHLIKLLKGHLLADTSTLIPSVNALVPLTTYLGLYGEEQLQDENRKALLYWLLGAWVHARFSGAAQTAIAQDVSAVRSDDPVKRLYANLGLIGHRLVVTDAMLAGRGSTSAYFFLSYLCARRAKANDWWHGVPVSATHDGKYKVEYHHIHPQATIKDQHSKAEVNDLANLAFISAKANRKISARSPADYFPEVGDDELARHGIPLDPALRSAGQYAEFVRARRRRLAAAMSQLLEEYRPAWLDPASGVAEDPNEGEKLVFEVYGSGPTSSDLVWVATASAVGQRWSDVFSHEALVQLMDDVESGRGGEIVVGGEVIGVPGEAEEVVLPLGPLQARGSLVEWRKVIDRELADLRPLSQLPHVEMIEPWEGPRMDFPVLDSE